MRLRIVAILIAAALSILIVLRNADANFRLGLMLRDKRAYNTALLAFERTRYLNPRYAGVNLEIGKLYFLKPGIMGFEQALDAFSREIEISNRPYAHHERGILYGSHGAYDKAEADFRQEMALWSSWGAPLDLAWILFAEGRFSEAEDMMKVVAERKPDSVWAHNGLGVVYLNERKIREAIAELSAAFAKAETMTRADYLEAYPGLDPAEAPDGIKNIKTGIAYNLALAYEKQGDRPAALDWYQRALSLIRTISRTHIANGLNEETIASKIAALKQ